VLALSCNFTFSHVYCSKGEQWIIGAEMPPPKHDARINNSPCCTGNCHLSDEKSGDKRKKDTFEFKFELDGKNVPYQKIDKTTYDVGFLAATTFKQSDKLLNRATIKAFSKTHPPPDLFNPELAQIQVFRI
jgi:hypothetical protein